MSITLPAQVPGYTGPLWALGGALLLVDITTQSTFFSYDSGSTWSAGVSWDPSSTFFGHAGVATFDGTYIIYAGAFYDILYNYTIWTGRSSNGILWTTTGAKDLFVPILGSGVPGTLHAVSGTLWRIHRFESYLKAWTSSDLGLNWNTGTASNLLSSAVGIDPVSGGPAIIRFQGYFWSLPPGGAGGKAIYRSTDCITWTEIVTDWGLGTEHLQAYQVIGLSVVITTQENETWVSVDMLTWEKQIYSTISMGSGVSLAQLGDDLFLAGAYNLYKLLNFTDPGPPSPIGHPL